MILSKEKKEIIKHLTDKKIIKDKYYGINAVNKAKQLFFTNNEEANKWANYWTNNEKKNSIYFTYFVKKKQHAKFIIGDGNRLSVLGEKNIM